MSDDQNPVTVENCVKPEQLYWGKATLTSQILAKPVRWVTDHASSLAFRSHTGAHEALDLDAVLCVNLGGAMFQLKSEQLLARHVVTDIQNGWMVCSPKPEYAKVEYFHADEDFFEEYYPDFAVVYFDTADGAYPVHKNNYVIRTPNEPGLSVLTAEDFNSRYKNPC